MNLLQISLTNKCNKACSYCPVEKWRNNPVYPCTLTNERLFGLLERLSPNEWAIELTGGEPALYPELDELLSWLQAKGFRGLIKTNGSLPIRRVGNFKRIAAFHELAKPPYFFDEILIIAHTPDFQEKIEWCLASGFPFKAIEESMHYRGSKDDIPCIGQIMFANPEGGLSECAAGAERVPIESGRLPSRRACAGCKSAKDFMAFFKEEDT